MMLTDCVCQTLMNVGRLTNASTIRSVSTVLVATRALALVAIGPKVPVSHASVSTVDCVTHLLSLRRQQH